MAMGIQYFLQESSQMAEARPDTYYGYSITVLTLMTVSGGNE